MIPLMFGVAAYAVALGSLAVAAGLPDDSGDDRDRAAPPSDEKAALGRSGYLVRRGRPLRRASARFRGV